MKRKTPYSRKGCLECKKSHYKCDEKQPKCSSCVKRNKGCTYNLNFINNNHNNTKTVRRDTIATVPSTVFPQTTNLPNSDILATDFLNFDGEIPPFDIQDFFHFTPQNDSIIWKDIEQVFTDTSLLKNDWRATSRVQLEKMFEEKDPIFKRYHSMKEPVVLDYIEDQKIFDFTWSVIKESICCYNMVLFPKDRWEKVLEIILRLKADYKIIEYVLIHDSATLIMDFHKESGHSDIAMIWQKKVFEPSLNSCLNVLKDRLNSSDDFCENVAFLFSVLLLFSASTCKKYGGWRTHLKGSYLLLLKVGKLVPTDKSIITEREKDSLLLFEVLKDWFCHAEWSAQITSDNGGAMTNPHHFELSGDLCTVCDIDIIRGYDVSLLPVMNELCTFLIDMKSKGINLSGTNLVLYKFTNQNQETIRTIRDFGLRLYTLLDCTQQINEDNSGSRDSRDYLLWFSIKNGNKLYHLGLRAYLKTFFLPEGPNSRKEIMDILEYMLETAYAIPYLPSTGIVSHWPVYIAGLVSAVIGEETLFKEFLKITEVWMSSGIYVAENSRDRLLFIHDLLQEKNYTKLVDPYFDSIVY